MFGNDFWVSKHVQRDWGLQLHGGLEVKERKVKTVSMWAQ